MAARRKTSDSASSAQPLEGFAEILLEIGNICIQGGALKVQLRADREPDKPRWWPTKPLDESHAAAQFKGISEALEKKRPVFARVKAENGLLTIDAISIQYAETIR